MVTIKAVAKAAGVSVGTVSHVLNHPDRVTADKRKAVEDAIKQLGYVPSEAGRRLRQGSSKFVGVLVLEISNPFFAQAAESIEDTLAERGYIPMILSSRGDPERELAFMRLLAGQQVRGLIITPGDRTIEHLQALPVFDGRVVFMDHPPIVEDIPTVSSDDVAGAAQAITYLRGLGHSDIGFVNGPLHIRQARDRRLGVQRAIADNGGTVREQSAQSFSVPSGYEATMALMKNSSGTSAIFYASDQLAIGGIRALRDLGRRVPQDVSVVGYDDVEIARDLTPPLTTIRQPMEQIGRTSVELLFANASHPRHVVFEPTLIERESTSHFAG